MCNMKVIDVKHFVTASLRHVCSIFWCDDQFLHSRADVHLLRIVSTWTTHAEVSLVEEVFNSHPAGSYFIILLTRTHNHLTMEEVNNGYPN